MTLPNRVQERGQATPVPNQLGIGERPRLLFFVVFASFGTDARRVGRLPCTVGRCFRCVLIEVLLRLARRARFGAVVCVFAQKQNARGTQRRRPDGPGDRPQVP